MTMDLWRFTYIFYFFYHWQYFDRTWLYICVIRWVSYKKQELLTLTEHLISPPNFGGVRVAHLFSFLRCHIMCLYVLSSMLWCPLWSPHKNDVRSFLYLQLFVGGLVVYLRYLCLFTYSGVQRLLCCGFGCVCLRLVCPILPVCLDCPFLFSPSVFSNVYLKKIIGHLWHKTKDRVKRTPLKPGVNAGAREG